MLYALCLIQQNGMLSSGIIHITWIIHFICSLADVYTMFFKHFYFTIFSIMNVVWILGVLAQSILFAFADFHDLEDQLRYEMSEEDSSSFLNRQLYYWFSQLTAVGYKKGLVIDDLFQLNYGMRSDFLISIWEQYWIPTIESLFNIQLNCFINDILEYNQRKKLLENNDKNYLNNENKNGTALTTK